MRAMLGKMRAMLGDGGCRGHLRKPHQTDVNDGEGGGVQRAGGRVPGGRTAKTESQLGTRGSLKGQEDDKGPEGL